MVSRKKQSQKKKNCGEFYISINETLSKKSFHIPILASKRRFNFSYTVCMLSACFH